MKTIEKLFILVSVSVLTCFTSCKTTADTQKETYNKSQTETNVEPVSTSMEQLWFWQKSEINSYNPQTGVLTVAAIPDEWNAFTGKLSESDAKNNNYLEIKYSNPTKSFTCRISYTNSESTDSIACEATRSVRYVPLTTEFKDNIKHIEIISNNDGKALSVKIESLRFVKDQILAAPEVDNGPEAAFNSDISAIDFVKQMKAGWNLGNTLEANGDWLPKGSMDSETAWDSPWTTEEIISIGINNGMKTIRIPVTWYNHIVDDSYTIDGDWMRRVKTIVNWAIADGYYVILNEHHSVRDNMSSPLKKGDCYIVRTDENDIAESKAFLKAVWTQIAAAFNSSYDEHLIFETMNEPRDSDKNHGHTWFPAIKTSWCDYTKCEKCLTEYKVLNEYNQICLDAIRASGGNNARRFVMIPALCTGIEPAKHSLFKLPEDSAVDKLIMTVHDYRLGSGINYAVLGFTEEHKSEIDSDYKILNEKYISKGIPVVAGETGAVNKIPLDVRVNWIKYFGSVANNYGISVIYWECGDDSESSMSLFDRENVCVREEQKEFVTALTEAFK